MDTRNWLRQSTQTQEKESKEEQQQHQTTEAAAKPSSDDSAELQLAPCAEPPRPSKSTARIMAPQPPQTLIVPDDLGTEEPAQVTPRIIP